MTPMRAKIVGPPSSATGIRPPSQPATPQDMQHEIDGFRAARYLCCGAAHAQEATPEIQVMSVKIMREVSEGLQCQASSIKLAKENKTLKARVKDLESKPAKWFKTFRSQPRPAKPSGRKLPTKVRGLSCGS
jgi:hypothetical protein